MQVDQSVQSSGPINAILISGAIAFKAHPDEYRAATDWLVVLAEHAQCSSTEAYVVPGNHDVDRQTFQANRGAMLNAKHIADASIEPEKERALMETLGDDESAAR